MLITVQEHFHNSESITIRVHQSCIRYGDMTFRLTNAQRKRIERELCGIAGCCCDPVRRSTYTDASGQRWNAI